MKTDTFFEKYYNDALKISAICADLNLPASDSKLFTYIHIKALQNGGVEYFENEVKLEIKTLEMMLGKTKRSSFKQLSRLSRRKINFHPDIISKKLLGIEMAAKVNFGFEFPFKYELENRLKLHTNSEFRALKVDFYVTTIAPRFKFYTEEDITKAFQNERDRLGNIREKLSKIT